MPSRCPAIPVLALLLIPVPSRAEIQAFGLVLVANSSGDVRTAGNGLREAVAQCGLPLRVEDFVWSYGPGRYLTDHLDHANHRLQGQRLARHVAAVRAACPGLRICLVGHSAGAAVVLAAAEALPPGCVDRLVLLAPSVADDYDLRGALRVSREGIDSFLSRRDVLQLGVGVGLVGTADNRRRPAAGRVGFRPWITHPGDGRLYEKLRQHVWWRGVRWTGNFGGHFGNSRPDFLAAYVLPLLWPT